METTRVELRNKALSVTREGSSVGHEYTNGRYNLGLNDDFILLTI